MPVYFTRKQVADAIMGLLKSKGYVRASDLGKVLGVSRTTGYRHIREFERLTGLLVQAQYIPNFKKKHGKKVWVRDWLWSDKKISMMNIIYDEE